MSCGDCGASRGHLPGCPAASGGGGSDDSKGKGKKGKDKKPDPAAPVPAPAACPPHNWVRDESSWRKSHALVCSKCGKKWGS